VVFRDKSTNYSVQRFTHLKENNVSIDSSNPQKTLNLKDVYHKKGFIGYLVNLIHMEEKYLNMDLR
jgi:hypothetical protein